MSLTKIDTAVEHEKYENMSVQRRIAVGCAFDAAIKALQANGVHKADCAMDDRAEELVAAIAYYMRRSSIV